LAEVKLRLSLICSIDSAKLQTKKRNVSRGTEKEEIGCCRKRLCAAFRKFDYVRRDSIKNSDVSRGTIQKATVWPWMNAFYCDALLSFTDPFSARWFRCMRYTGLATMLLWPIAQKFIES